MMWRMIISKAPYLSADFTLLVDKINSGVLGNYQALPRWKVCLNEGESFFLFIRYESRLANSNKIIQVIKHLPHSVGFMYKEEAFSKAAKNDIYEMIENIKIAFQEMFQKNCRYNACVNIFPVITRLVL